MYYLKIPLRNLSEPHQLNVPEDKRDALWRQRAKSLLDDVRGGMIPSWAVDYEDLRNVEICQEEANDSKLQVKE